MKSIPTKHIISTLAISFISLGATAGLALPVSARSADVVAPTFVVSGVNCGHSGSVIATLLPGQSLAGDVVITSNPGYLFMADSNASLLQSFIATTPPAPQPFTVTNRTMGTDTIFACNSSLPLLSVVNAKVIDTATGIPLSEGGGATSPIEIKVDAHANNNNTNGNTINVSNLLRNLIGHSGNSSDNNTYHHKNNHHQNGQDGDHYGNQRDNHDGDQGDKHYGRQGDNHYGNQDSDNSDSPHNMHHGYQSSRHYGRQHNTHHNLQYDDNYDRQHNAHYGNQHDNNGAQQRMQGHQHNIHQANRKDDAQ
ncbi:hypothetical protein [Dictyobacter vulcani]|uniref:hypothetical protein n=1 Tax=Dictyobacter vulcani TaxID=2607529 RepID=UPI0012504509|nr:hypothetical protein [Dictyobacter vulcani]